MVVAMTGDDIGSRRSSRRPAAMLEKNHERTKTRQERVVQRDGGGWRDLRDPAVASVVGRAGVVDGKVAGRWR